MTDTVRYCRNCKLVLPQPDSLSITMWPDSGEKCPRCGVEWGARPAWKGPEQEAFEEEEVLP